MIYPVVVHKDASSSYGVTIPDLPGVFTAGDTLEEALANVQEAVEAAYDGEDEVPGPSPFEVHQGNPEFQDGVLAIVNIDVSRIAGPAVRINITIPPRDLEAIDAAAKRFGTNRSSFLRDSALQVIAANSKAKKVQPLTLKAGEGRQLRSNDNAKVAQPGITKAKRGGAIKKANPQAVRKTASKASRKQEVPKQRG